MKKNKLYLIISVLIIALFFGSAATLNKCAIAPATISEAKAIDKIPEFLIYFLKSQF